VSDIIRRLGNGEIAPDGTVEVTITAGPNRGRRYAVRPREHNACHATGRALGEYDAATKARKAIVCPCVDSQVRRAENAAPKDPLPYEVDYDTEEHRRARRRERLTATLTAAQGELADLEKRATESVAHYHEQARASGVRAETLDRQQPELLAKADLAQRMLEQTRERRNELEGEFKRAKATLVHQEAVAREAVEALASARKAATGHRQTAEALRREAERVQRTSWADRLTGVKRAVAAIERDLAQLEAATNPAQDAMQQEIETAVAEGDAHAA